MSARSVDSLADGLLLRIGTRENAERRAVRLLVEGRVMIRRVDDRGVLADVRGDSGSIYSIGFDAHAEMWSCDCPARSERCSHVRAVQLVVVPVVQR